MSSLMLAAALLTAGEYGGAWSSDLCLSRVVVRAAYARVQGCVRERERERESLLPANKRANLSQPAPRQCRLASRRTELCAGPSRAGEQVYEEGKGGEGTGTGTGRGWAGLSGKDEDEPG